MSRELQLAHERIQDLEALVAGRPLPVRRRPTPLLGILVLVLAAMAGVFLPLQRTSSVPTRRHPAPVPSDTLVLADNAAPVFAKWAGRDLALFRGWWPGRESMPLHVVALDCADWSVRWISQEFPATAFDRGALRADDNGAAFLFTSTGLSQHRQFVIGTDDGFELGSTDVPSRWELDDAVREGPLTDALVVHGVGDSIYSLKAGILGYRPEDEYAYGVRVPGIPVGSHLGSMALVKSELVIVANDSIFIVDAATGQLKKRIDSF